MWSMLLSGYMVLVVHRNPVMLTGMLANSRTQGVCLRHAHTLESSRRREEHARAAAGRSQEKGRQMGETQSQTGYERLHDVDDALTREVDHLARRYPHIDRDEIDRQVHVTYRDLESHATIQSHLVTVTAAHVADRLREQSPPEQAEDVFGQPPHIPTYEDQPAGAPTELDLERQRAGVDTSTNPVSEQIASPLWVAGLGPPSGDYGRSRARDDSASGRPGIASRIRSMLTGRDR